MSLSSSPQSSGKAAGLDATLPTFVSRSKEASFINVDSVSKYFERTERHLFHSSYLPGPLVLKNINLQVAPLSFVALIGPSGCGKSTLLNMLAGLIEPSSGTIEITGQPLNGTRQQTSMVFQTPSLIDWNDVYQNVAIALRLKQRKKVSSMQKEQVLHYIDLVGLSFAKDLYPRKLSGGMQQRVGIARALVTEPDLLLMDEPFGALDAQTRLMLQEELQRLCENYRATVVFVTHDIDEAIYLADRIIVLSTHPGEIVESIEIPFQRPRYEYDVHGLSEFNDMRRHILGLIRQNMERDSKLIQ